jgi:hypothetical protein
MNLPGSKQAGIAKKVLEQFEWWRFEPHEDWAEYAGSENAAMLKAQWGRWIWFDEGDATVNAPVAKRYFRKSFEIAEGAKPASGVLWLSVDDRFDATLNGKHVGSRRGGWESPQPIDIIAALHAGRNVLTIEAENLAAPVAANPAGLIASLRIRGEDGKEISIASDETWEASKQPIGDADANVNITPAKVLGSYGCKPWGEFVARPERYGPFAAGIPKVRLIYIPQSQSIRVLNLEAGATYRAKAIDPASGDSADFPAGAVVADPKGQCECAKPASLPVSGAGDWVLVLERAE